MNHMLNNDRLDAPWNQVDLPDKEIEVTVSVTLSKNVKILVDDYKVIEEDGSNMKCDFTDCDLHSAVKNQIKLPQDNEYEDWSTDDFEVILE